MDDQEREIRERLEAREMSGGIVHEDDVRILLRLLGADRGRVLRLQEAARAVVEAWDHDDVGMVDGGLIDDLRALTESPAR